jgi:hypothetical protein
MYAATALITSAAFIGCSFDASIRYPLKTTLAGPPAAAVAMEAVNHRPPEHGGQGTRIGTVRGGFGNPFPVHELDASNITRAVTDAVADGLGRAGISVDDKSAQVLVVTVNDYWLDGYGAFNASVKVDLALHDAQGAPVWQQSLAGSGGAVMSAGVFQADAVAQSAFERALAGIAVQASQLFVANEFRQLLRPVTAPAEPET